MKKINSLLLAFLMVCQLAFAGTKITELTELTVPDVADIIPIVDDVSGTPTTKKVALSNIIWNYDATNDVYKTGDITATDTGSTPVVSQDQHLTLQDNAASASLVDDEAAQNGLLVGGDNTADITTITGLPSGITRGLALDGLADYINTQKTFNTGANGWSTFWVNLDNHGANQILWGFQGPTDNDRFYVRADQTTGYARLGIGDNTSASTFSITTGTPHLIKIVWTAATDTMQLYVDDVLRHTYSNTIGNLTQTIFLGANNYHGGVSAYADGTFADFRAEEGTLTSEENDVIWNSGDGTTGNGSAGFLNLQSGAVVSDGNFQSSFISPLDVDKGWLGVEGKTHLQGAVKMDTTLNVVGDATLDANLSVGGTFTMTGSGDSNFGDVLYVDDTNNRVGVNDTTPDLELDVVGDAAISGDIVVGNETTGDLLKLYYAAGVEIQSFRGTTDTDVTGWVLYNADGEACYVYPNATQDGILVSGTQP